MSTLLLRLSAPLQAWGVNSRFETRSTERMPSKSGVIGLLAAAMGIKRDGDISELSALKFGVRTDKEGRLLRDFHMARHFTDTKRSYVTNRFYLQDAVFLVGLEGNDELISTLEGALKAPAFPLFLGRRSCPPAGELVIGVRNASLEQALFEEPPLVEECKDARITVDSTKAGARLQRDLPISFDQAQRKFAFRLIEDKRVIFSSEESATEHDAMAELEEKDVFIAS